ncbi:hypothetical protein QBC40DRAFT_235642 [Triangularia verruculosa]|uniref:Uncharacterized protein n=1 Tax=Triangularia verruculosa TaxID=2587418 RepID=A0AAN6XA45_9PEZI|nr:hypothetical protein QBC40DRAFT_235642 [Triangularia verruculosa]
MAPLANEPRQVLHVLNHARRRALYGLLIEITAYMRSQIELTDPPAVQLSNSSPPLRIDPNAQGSSIIDERPTLIQVSNNGFVTRSDQDLARINAAALKHFDKWRGETLTKLKELLAAQDDAKSMDERRKRTERMKQKKPAPGAAEGSLIDFGGGDSLTATGDDAVRREAVARLQLHWHPIPTRMTTIPYEDRLESLSCVLLELLSTGHYTAESRALAVYLASALEIPLDALNAEEIEIAKAMVEGSEAAARQQKTRAMSADREAERRRQQNQAGRFLKVGLASVAGAALIGVTGGLAAPVVAGAIGGLMGTVGLGGVASFLGIFWMNGALVGALFGAFGARMTGEMVDKYARDVEDFKFIPLADEWGTRNRANSKDSRRLRVTIGVNGWLTTEDDITKPWRHLADDAEVFALRYELNALIGLGTSLKKLVNSYAWNTVKMEILKRTVLASLWGALWPAYLLSAASTLDNPFALAKNRSEKAGEVLADALINKVQGERPVTLIGYSLGARVIYSCLRSLAKRRAFGLIDSVVFMGAPIPSNREHWQMMRSVVSGRIYNAYSENDYILAFLYRATSIQMGVAGLQKIQHIEGVENLDLSEEVSGHMRYAGLIEKILARCDLPVGEGVDRSIARDVEDPITGPGLDNKASSSGNLLIELGDMRISSPQQKPQQPKQGSPPPYSYAPSQSSQNTGLAQIQSPPLPKVQNQAAVIQNCPICNHSLSGSSEDQATSHVNSCLDGNQGGVPSPVSAPPPPAVTSPSFHMGSSRGGGTNRNRTQPQKPTMTRSMTSHLQTEMDPFGLFSPSPPPGPPPKPAPHIPAPPDPSKFPNLVNLEGDRPPTISRSQTVPLVRNTPQPTLSSSSNSPPRVIPMAAASASTPAVYESSHYQGQNYDSEDYETDEEYGGGIKMVNNDDEPMEFIDPRPMD